MSTKLIQRVGLLGSTAALALLAVAMPAQAVETTFGEVQIVFDTTVSMGGSIRTADRDNGFLAEGNGGNVDPRSGPGDILVIPGAAGAAFLADLTPQPSFAPGGAGVMRWTNNVDNFDGSVNADDARLNYDSGDFVGATLKASHDLQLTWENYKFFARAVGFYDFVMNNRDAGERSEIIDAALGDVGRNYELLDAFVSADYTIGDLPVNLRLGKQVINWGESTFILGGNNVFNPIDVAAFRRPGSEIKEALVPVNAAFGSISLPFDVSLSGYYALDWEPFELDPSGTPFSSSDVVALGTGQGGNAGRVSFLSGSPFSGARRVCDLGAADGNAGLATTYFLGLLPNPTGINVGGLGAAATGVGNGYIDCLDVAAGPNFVDKTVPYTIGRHESVKLGLIDALSSEGFDPVVQGVVSRDNDFYADNTGDYGLSAKYYAEDLGGTEFGFYYQNYSSRLPFASENARTMTVAVSTVSHSTQVGSAAAKLATPTGCLVDLSAGTFLDPRIQTAVLGNTGIADPQNLLTSNGATGSLDVAFAVTGAGVPFNSAVPGVGYDNIYNAAVLQCALSLFQSATSAVSGAPTLFDGAEILTYAADIGLFIEYPEGIDVWGMSFNTVLFGWGVQGDFTFRPDAPFQIDTDSITIAAAMEECAFASVGDLMATFEALGTYAGHTCFSGGTAGNEAITGVMFNEMYTAQIGTTATFTASEWPAQLVDADLGILVTEIGLVYVPNVEDTWIDRTGTSNLHQQFQNIGCQGSDLPLGGLLALDHKTSEQCRPTDFSAGLVVLYQLDYNNAFDTGFVVSPRIAYSYDFEGATPAPYGNYLEDRQSVNLGVTGTLNNNFRLSASYTNFFGGHIANKVTDTDFASLTASYTF